MLATAILFLLVSSSSGSEEPDFQNTDYCAFPCVIRGKSGQKLEVINSTLCNCQRRDTHFEQLEDLFEFRRKMVEAHNVLRNKLADGKLMFPDGQYYPMATNMRAVSYSEELEYSARCWAVQIDGGHDKCRATSQFEVVGQNIYFDADSLAPWHVSIYSWWEQYEDLEPKLVEDFQIPEGRNLSEFQDFVNMAWAQTFQIGCARSYNPYSKVGNHSYVLICNYASSGVPANTIGHHIYEPGLRCDGCKKEYGIHCNNEYPNLCGETDTVPMTPPIPIDYSEGERAVLTTVLLVFGFFVQWMA